MDRGKASSSTSLLSKKVNIVGDIQGNEDLHVEGRFKGSIKITGNIFVGQTGLVEADVEAEGSSEDSFQVRVTSPLPFGSTFMTLAPSSEKNIPTLGPANTLESSKTLMSLNIA